MQRKMIDVFIAIGSISVGIFIWTTIKIYSFLRARKEKTESFLFLNLFIFKYICEYRALTKKENGRVGYLFYLYIVSINIALICFIVLMIFKNS
jgi:hypothetical protein